MTFKTATRAGTKALIGLYGESGSGKTLSSLLLARGLAGPDGQVFMIDTENGRGRIFSDEIPGGYQIEEMTEPFSSQRYSDAIKSAEDQAAGRPAALVIDSLSHEWEGIGGVCNAAEMVAEARAKKAGYQWDGRVNFGDWNKPKTEHKRMVLKMLGSPLHIICCFRADYKSHQVEKKDYAKYGINSNAKTTIIRDDFQSPIQDRKFIFEMMIHAELSNKAPGVPKLTKCPGMIAHAFPDGKQITGATGEMIAEWTSGGAPDTKEMDDLMREAGNAASCGTTAYREWFEKLDKPSQISLTDKGTGGPHVGFKQDAIDADQEREGADA